MALGQEELGVNWSALSEVPGVTGEGGNSGGHWVRGLSLSMLSVAHQLSVESRHQCSLNVLKDALARGKV